MADKYLAGYAWHADTYCCECMQDIADELDCEIDDAVDPEGNHAGAIPTFSEWDTEQHCAACHVELNVSVLGWDYEIQDYSDAVRARIYA